jgi:hypothetical protein
VDDLSSCCLRWMRKLEGSSPNLVSPRVYGTLRFRQRGSAAHTGPYAVLGSFETCSPALVATVVVHLWTELFGGRRRALSGLTPKSSALQSPVIPRHALQPELH